VSYVAGLRALPLFKGISSARLEELFATFRPTTRRAGAVLFEPGDRATHLDLLTRGEVIIEEEPSGGRDEAVRFELRPVSALGELGALTGIPRCTTASAKTDVEIHSIPIEKLLAFFDRHGDVGVAFYRNLLAVVSDKVRRDRRRMDEMRANIIRTQKAMKSMRETVLSAPETAISKPIFETLDTLIDNNRRANYRVIPSPSYPAHVRLDDGRKVNVLEVSEGYVKIEGRIGDVVKDPAFWTGVLCVPTDEILLSGTVLREGEGGVVVKLDKPVDEYRAKLDDYTTRVQLLDFVV
jgi:CRP/FNR family transcriptional regulator, cyclic AMP receptor protein